MELDGHVPASLGVEGDYYRAVATIGVGIMIAVTSSGEKRIVEVDEKRS